MVQAITEISQVARCRTPRPPGGARTRVVGGADRSAVAQMTAATRELAHLRGLRAVIRRFPPRSAPAAAAGPHQDTNGTGPR